MHEVLCYTKKICIKLMKEANKVIYKTINSNNDRIKRMIKE